MVGSVWNKLIWILLPQIPPIFLLRGIVTFSIMWYAGMSSCHMSDVLDSNHQAHNGSWQNQLSFGICWNIHRSWASEFIFSTMQINSGEVADEAASNFTASVASKYWLRSSKITLSDINNDLHGPELFLRHKERLRKLWHETGDTGLKTAVIRVTKTIRRMTRSKTLKRWRGEGKCDVTSPAMWLVEHYIKSNRTKASTDIRGPLGIKWHPLEKANATADFFQNRFALPWLAWQKTRKTKGSQCSRSVRSIVKE